MPLAHAILGFLDYEPMSGYDLRKAFDQSIAHFWSATQSHIYRALETLEAETMAGSEVIPQEGKPSRRVYSITAAGRSELRRWVTTPLPADIPRHAWLIQVFFAHGADNAELVRLIEQRIVDLRTRLEQCRSAQAGIDSCPQMPEIKRMRGLWQLTLDYGLDYYTHEIAWLQQALPRVRRLPALAPRKG